MERALNKLGNLPEAKPIPGLIEAINGAREAVGQKEAVPANLRRERCLHACQLLLAAGKVKPIYVVVEGLQLLLNDPSLSSDSGTAREIDCLPYQFLACIEPLPHWLPAIQCQILPVLAQLIATHRVPLATALITVKICRSTYRNADAAGSVRQAVRACLNQSLTGYCQNRHEDGMEDNLEIGALMDVSTLLNEFVPALLPNSGATEEDLQVCLDSLIAILGVQPPNYKLHPPLERLLRAELIPALINLMHHCEGDTSAGVGIKQLSFKFPLVQRQHNGAAQENEEVAKAPATPALMRSPDMAHSAYRLIELVLALFAPECISSSTCDNNENGESAKRTGGELKLCLLELFQSALLCPRVVNRSEALRLVKRMAAGSNQPPSTLFGLMAVDENFWFELLECLEECCRSTTKPDGIAVEALRTFRCVTDSMASLAQQPTIKQEWLALLLKFSANQTTEEDNEEIAKHENSENVGGEKLLKYNSDTNSAVADWLRAKLTSCWGAVTAITSRYPLLPMMEKRDVYASALTKLEHSSAAEGADASLECYLSLCRLTFILGMLKELSALLAQLTSDLCPVEALRRFMDPTTTGDKSALSMLPFVPASLHLRNLKADTPKRWLLTDTDRRGIAFISQNALNYGGRSAELWESIVICIVYCGQLENFLVQAPDNGDPPSAYFLSLQQLRSLVDESSSRWEKFFASAPVVLSMDSLCVLLRAMAKAGVAAMANQTGCVDACNLLRRSVTMLRLRFESIEGRDATLTPLWESVNAHLVTCCSANNPVEIQRLAMESIEELLPLFLQHQLQHDSENTSSVIEIFPTILATSPSAETHQHLSSILTTLIRMHASLIADHEWRPLFAAVKLLTCGVEVLQAFTISIQEPRILIPSALNEFILCTCYKLKEGDLRLLELVHWVQRTLDRLASTSPALHADANLTPLAAKLQRRTEKSERVESEMVAPVASSRLPPLSSLLHEWAELGGVSPAELDQLPPSHAIIAEEAEGHAPWSGEYQHLAVVELSLALVEGLSHLLHIVPSTGIEPESYRQLVDTIAGIAFGSEESLGPAFSAYCAINFVIPAMRALTREPNCAKYLEIAMDSISPSVAEAISMGIRFGTGRDLLLRNWLLFLRDTIAQNTDAHISSIGLAQLEHTLTGLCRGLTAPDWCFVAHLLWGMSQSALTPTRVLIAQFFAASTDIDGDFAGSIRVEMLKPNDRPDGDSNRARLAAMARKVLHYGPRMKSGGDGHVPQAEHADDEPAGQLQESADCPESGRHAYRFLIAGDQPMYITVDEVVTSLHSQLTLVKLIGELLPSCVINDQKAVVTLLYCLDATQLVAEQFNVRPALRMILNKLVDFGSCDAQGRRDWVETSLYSLVVEAETRRLELYARMAQPKKAEELGDSCTTSRQRARKLLAARLKELLDDAWPEGIVENGEQETLRRSIYELILTLSSPASDEKAQHAVDEKKVSARLNPFKTTAAGGQRRAGIETQCADKSMKQLSCREILRRVCAYHDS